MRRLAAVAVVAVAALFSGLGGNANAASFALVPTSLPSAKTPNKSGSLVLPAAWTERATRPQAVSTQSLRDLWRRAGAGYGIPWEVLAAINEIETNFGSNMRPSSAGAVGWMQFMPDTWLRWGMDGSGDGVADPWNAEDAVFSAARYLAAAGGAADLRRAIFAYNHADWYVADVLRLAALHAGGDRALSLSAVTPAEAPAVTAGAGNSRYVAFSLDRPLITLEQAGRDVAAAKDRLARAVASEQAFAEASARLLSRAGRIALLSRRLSVQKQAMRADSWRHEAASRVTSLREALAAAEAALERAREAAESARLTQASSAILLSGGALIGSGAAASTADGRYVFPVGGGPATVSIPQTHHDYPAADIAAPMGAPVYAHTSSTVVNSWHGSDGRCGIGLTLRTDDDLTWTYCHLSYLDPRVTGGTVLAAGAQIGLVGSTGNSSGPHLHLQLDPTTIYPQDYAWLRSFAGSAFRWQDSEPLRPVIGALDGSTGTFASADAVGAVVTFTP